METTRWTVDEELDEGILINDPGIREAAALLREGRLVAFPTETVYGLGADARSEEAVSAIYRAKGRPSDNPLIVHIADLNQLKEWVGKVPPLGQALIRRFWPGPLTLVLRYRRGLASQVTAGLSTVGVRMPAHPVSLALLRAAGVPVAAPSANQSGKPSPTEADHVWDDLAGRIDGLLDGGPTGVGVESTVVDVTGEVPILLRPGGVTLDRLRKVAGRVDVDPGLEQEGEAPRSPGMKYRHYAPQGEMWLVMGEGEALRRRMAELARQASQAGNRVGILTTEENQSVYQADKVLSLGSRKDPASVARNLYAALRTCDDARLDVIYAEAFPMEGVYHSVMNRLLKAAEGRVIPAE
ncbi:L-threonylcarbamoyladenylate synthase [Salinithrix halophila]|uniref:Threonylcarbamoyl-AMP synthase n=1 Tax=Salinithrix halophila TaxID=1485204 RepID=A0ABV8JJD2_9BACL